MTKPGPGKFEGNTSLEVAETLYEWLGEGSADEECGDVDGYGSYYALFDVDGADVDAPEGMRGKAYVTEECSQGFFTYLEFDSFYKTEAESAYRIREHDYEVFVDPSQGGPEEGDLTTENHRQFWVVGATSRYPAIDLTEDESEEWQKHVKAYMDRQQFWPNVWSVSDHGNTCLLSLDEE